MPRPKIYHAAVDTITPAHGKVKCACGRTLNPVRTKAVENGRLCKQCAKKARSAAPPTPSDPQAHQEQREAVQPTREQQMADAAKWYDKDNYEPMTGWQVEHVKLTSMPRYWGSDEEGWSAEGTVGVNFSCEMPVRPQYIEREEGYALRLDVESIDWRFHLVSQVTGEVVDTGWFSHSLVGGYGNQPDSRFLTLFDGALWSVQAQARPRLRRAKYDPGAPRTEELWSSEASGIGESEPSDVITASEVYHFQWNADRDEMLSWVVGTERPESHLPWAQSAEAEQPDLAFAEWMRDARSRVLKQFDFMDAAYAARQVGLTPERYEQAESGQVMLHATERKNIERVLFQWLGALE